VIDECKFEFKIQRIAVINQEQKKTKQLNKFGLNYKKVVQYFIVLL